MPVTELPALLGIMDLVGIAIFALCGAVLAARLQQTFVTMAFFALVTGVGGVEVDDLVSFYRGIWKAGDAGVTVVLELRRGTEEKKVSVPSVDRTRFLKLDNSL